MSKNAVIIDGKGYASAMDVARKLNIDYSQVLHRLNSDSWPEWIIASEVTSVIVDGISYAGIQEAADALKLTTYKLKQRLMEVGNGLVLAEKPVALVDRKQKLRTGSKPVSIDGVVFPTVGLARYYISRYGSGPITRNPVLARLNSTDPKWAGWKFITEEELPALLPDKLTDCFSPSDKNGCFLHECGFMVMYYANDPAVGRYAIIPGVTVDDQSACGKNSLSTKLNDGTFLNIVSDKLPQPGTPDHEELAAALNNYLLLKGVK